MWANTVQTSNLSTYYIYISAMNVRNLGEIKCDFKSQNNLGRIDLGGRDATIQLNLKDCGRGTGCLQVPSSGTDVTDTDIFPGLAGPGDSFSLSPCHSSSMASGRIRYYLADRRSHATTIFKKTRIHGYSASGITVRESLEKKTTGITAPAMTGACLHPRSGSGIPPGWLPQ